MQFLWELNLWLLLLVPALVVLYVVMLRRRRRYAVRYASLSLVRDALGKGPGVRRHIPPTLFLASLALMLIGAARPVTVVTVPIQEGTVILAMDVSGSMLAEDISPNRMEAAKRAAKTFVDRQSQYVRIGIVSFSGDASIVQAPTTDKELVNAAIDRLRPQRATAIGRGILISLDAIFEESEEEPPSAKYLRPGAEPDANPPASSAQPLGSFAAASIVLLSDGQNNQFPPPLSIIDEAITRGVRVYTIGLGSAEGTVLRLQGRAVRTRLDEATLKKIAELTDAQYFRAASEAELRGIYENLTTQLVFRQEKSEVTAYFTVVAAVLALLAATLSVFWFGRLL